MNPDNNNDSNPFQSTTDDNLASTPQPETTPEVGSDLNTPLQDPIGDNVPTSAEPLAQAEPSEAAQVPVESGSTQVSDIFSSAAPAPISDASAVDTESSTSDSPSQVTSGSGKKNSKLVLILSIVAAVLLLGVGAAFAVQHFLGESDGQDSEQTVESTAPIDDSEGEGVDPVDEAGDLPKSETVINKTITDDELGFSINATSIVVNPFAIPERFASANSGKTVVLIETTIRSEGKYTGSPSATSLRLIDASGRVVVSTTIVEDQMKDAGYTPAPFSGPTAGESTTGYTAYLVETDQVSDLTLQYNRLAATVIGSGGETIPAKTFEVKLND